MIWFYPIRSPKRNHVLFSRLTIASCAILLSGCAGTSETLPPPPISQTAPRPARVPQERKITPGEILDIFVLEDESFNGRYLVRAGGDIILPKIGRVQIAGGTLAQAESAIQAKLSVDQLRAADVIVDRTTVDRQEKEIGGAEVYLTGKVIRPGRVSLPHIGGQPPTAYQAVLDAGGFSKFADKKRSYLLRRSPDGRVRRISIDLAQVEQGTGHDIPVQSGDTLIVPEKTFGF